MHIKCALLRPASTPPVEGSLSSAMYIWWCEKTFFFCRETDTMTKDNSAITSRQMQPMNGWWRKQTRKNKRKIGCMNKHRFILSILSDFMSSLKLINANQHLCINRSFVAKPVAGVYWNYTEVLEYDATLQHSAFWWGNTVLDTLPPYIYYELLIKWDINI